MFAQRLLQDLDNRIVGVRQYESNAQKMNAVKKEETICQTTIAQLEHELAKFESQLETIRARHEV